MRSNNEFNFRTVKRNRKIGGGVGKTTPPTPIPSKKEIKQVIKNNEKPSTVKKELGPKKTPRRVNGLMVNIISDKPMYVEFYEFLYANRNEIDEVEFNLSGLKRSFRDTNKQQIDGYIESMLKQDFIRIVSRSRGKYAKTKLKLLVKPSLFETH